MKGGPLALAASVLAHALAAALWVHQPAPVPAVRAPLHVVLEDAAPAPPVGTRVKGRTAHPPERIATAPAARGEPEPASRALAMPVAAERTAPARPADALDAAKSAAVAEARAAAPSAASYPPRRAQVPAPDPKTTALLAAAAAAGVPNVAVPAAQRARAPSAQDPATPRTARGVRTALAAAELPPELALALGRHFRYPWAARRLGLEGEVRVRFAVELGGAVAPSGLARSSGHTLLDRAALAGLAQLARAEHLPDLGGQTVELPVQYRLHRQP